MFKKMGLIVLLIGGYSILASEYDEDDIQDPAGVEETKKGFSDPVNFFMAYEKELSQFSDEQLCILSDIVFDQNKSQASKLPSQIQEWLIEFGHLEPKDLVLASKPEIDLDEAYSEEWAAIVEQPSLDKLLETEVFSCYDPYVYYDGQEDFERRDALD